MEVPDLDDAQQVAAGGEDDSSDDSPRLTCIRRPNGVACWGVRTGEYSLDSSVTGSVAYPPKPVIAPLVAPRPIALGNRRACAISAEGAVVCWGERHAPATLENTIDFAQRPVALPEASRAIQVAVGRSATCAVLDDHGVACSDLAQAAPGDPETLTRISGLPRSVQVSTGGAHQCTLTEEGAIACWGDWSVGQRGPAPQQGFTADLPSIVAMPHGRRALQVAAGKSTTCALLDDHSVACWGENRAGTTGTGSIDPASRMATPPIVTEPTVVQGLSRVEQIAMSSGAEHACALTQEGRVFCWGWRVHGELEPEAASGRYPITIAPVEIRLR
jgi:alpha-tubulin suppressor-like RCC1 family protein